MTRLLQERAELVRARAVLGVRSLCGLQQLLQLGYSTAARPLPFGHPIGGAPSGSRSSAE